MLDVKHFIWKMSHLLSGTSKACYPLAGRHLIDLSYRTVNHRHEIFTLSIPRKEDKDKERDILDRDSSYVSCTKRVKR